MSAVRERPTSLREGVGGARLPRLHRPALQRGGEHVAYQPRRTGPCPAHDRIVTQCNADVGIIRKVEAHARCAQAATTPVLAASLCGFTFQHALDAVGRRTACPSLLHFVERPDVQLHVRCCVKGQRWPSLTVLFHVCVL